MNSLILTIAFCLIVPVCVALEIGVFAGAYTLYASSMDKHEFATKVVTLIVGVIICAVLWFMLLKYSS